MRTIILLIPVILLFVAPTTAQWYSRQYGVDDINELTIDQLEYSLGKATSLKTGGILLTVVGTSAMLGGFIMAGNAMEHTLTLKATEKDAIHYGFSIVLVYGGFFLDAAGIPLWIIGEHRRTDIEFSRKYLFSSSISVDFSPLLSYNPVNRNFSPGIRIAFSF